MANGCGRTLQEGDKTKENIQQSSPRRKVISKGIQIVWESVECSTVPDFDCHHTSDPLIELSCSKTAHLS